MFAKVWRGIGQLAMTMFSGTGFKLKGSIRWISCTAFAALATAGARCSRAAAQSLRETGAVLLGGHMELEAY